MIDDDDDDDDDDDNDDELTNADDAVQIQSAGSPRQPSTEIWWTGEGSVECYCTKYCTTQTARKFYFLFYFVESFHSDSFHWLNQADLLGHHSLNGVNGDLQFLWE